MHSLNSLLASEFLVSWLPYTNLPSTVLWILAIYMITLTRHIIPLNEWGTGIVERLSNCFISSEEDYNVVAGQEYYQNTNGHHRPTKMYLAETEEQTRKAVAELMTDVRKFDIWIIGLDCEKCPEVKGRAIPCLLQLASDDGYAALFRVNKMDVLPAALLELLENENIWKVGVGVQNDVGDLEHRYNRSVHVRGTLDLRWLAEMTGYRSRSLKGLAEEALGAERNRHKSGQRWDAAELTMDQIMYASTDAFLGVELFFDMFHKLISQRAAGKKWQNLLPAERKDAITWLTAQLADKLDRFYQGPYRSSLVFTCFNIFSRFIFGWNNVPTDTTEEDYLRRNYGIIEQISSCFISKEHGNYLVVEPGRMYDKDPAHRPRPKKMYLAETEEHTKQALTELMKGGQKFGINVLGMDCEKCPDVKGRDTPCMLQLASDDDGFAALFRLNKMDTLPAKLIELLQNENIWKLGVGVLKDAQDLEHRYKQTFKVRRTLDLRFLADMVGYKTKTLNGLAEEALNEKPNRIKNKKAKQRKWDAPELLMEQMVYAATDAYWGVELFFKMFDELILKRTGGKKWANLLPEEKKNQMDWLKDELADKFDKFYSIRVPRRENVPSTSSNIFSRFFFSSNNASNTTEE